MRQDEFVIGADSGESKDETIIQVEGGCVRCGRSWPEVKFTKVAAAAASLMGDFAIQHAEDARPYQSSDILCDRCFDYDPSLDKAIEQATTGVVPGLIRSVEVTGIESKTNVVSFNYATHLGDKELVTTLLNVAFKTKVPGEFIWYVFRNVPTAVCEGWFAVPQHGQSFGSYFATQIKNSYDVEKKA